MEVHGPNHLESQFGSAFGGRSRLKITTEGEEQGLSAEEISVLINALWADILDVGRGIRDRIKNAFTKKEPCKLLHGNFKAVKQSYESPYETPQPITYVDFKKKSASRSTDHN